MTSPYASALTLRAAILAAARANKVPALEPYADDIAEAALRAGFNTRDRLSAFLGQCHVESAAYRTTVESLNYASDKLVSVFGARRITPEQADAVGRRGNRAANQQAIANIVYGGAWGKRNLGNTQPDDGWRFRGRGIKQLTGRANYARFSDWLYGDDRLLQDPDDVALAPLAVRSAEWFWVRNSLSPFADRRDYAGITKVINGGSNGLVSRTNWTRAYHRHLPPEN